jgi:hypothetical protein
MAVIVIDLFIGSFLPFLPVNGCSNCSTFDQTKSSIAGITPLVESLPRREMRFCANPAEHRFYGRPSQYRDMDGHAVGSFARRVKRKEIGESVDVGGQK